MREKRQSSRKNLTTFLEVYNMDTDSQIGHLVDVSEKGILIMSEEPITHDTQYNFKVIMPDQPANQDDICFTCKSVRSELNSVLKQYDTGFEILDIDQKKFQQIVDIMHELIFE